MALEKQIILLAELSNMGEGIPGLDPTPIIENIVNKSEDIKNQTTIIGDKYDTLEERGEIDKDKKKAAIKKEINDLIEAYKKQLIQIVNDQITEIRTEWKSIKASLKAIPDDVSKTIQNILLPPAITAPPAVPNPIYALNLAAQTKSLLIGLLNLISTSLVKVIKAANIILFELPEPVLAVGATVKVLDKILNTIPV
jgi:hypothetical protein